VRGGATHLDVTVGGLGERAGNAALEQVVMALEVCAHRHLTLRLEEIPSLCALVASFTGIPVPVSAPVVGDNAFRHTSGIHVHGMLKDPDSFQAYPPQLCGRTSSLGVDAHSGRTALRHVAAQDHGIRTLSDDDLDSLVTLARTGATVDTAIAAALRRDSGVSTLAHQR
jgi:homocitrate synthase NifV